MTRFVAVLRLVACGVLVTAFVEATPARADHNIYATHAERYLKLRKDQRKAVLAILAQAERELMAAFAKHGINPKAKPDFNKLVKARIPLQAVGQRERRKLKRILTPEQLAIYDRLVQEARARVIKATRKRD